MMSCQVHFQTISRLEIIRADHLSANSKDSILRKEYKVKKLPNIAVAIFMICLFSISPCLAYDYIFKDPTNNSDHGIRSASDMKVEGPYTVDSLTWLDKANVLVALANSSGQWVDGIKCEGPCSWVTLLGNAVPFNKYFDCYLFVNSSNEVMGFAFLSK